MMIGRRSFLTGLVATIATAPGVAKAIIAEAAPLATVNASHQIGNSLVITALNGTLQAGDIITIEGVNGLSRIDPESEIGLRRFVVTALAERGNTVIHIYPAIVPKGIDHPTVKNLPLNKAEVKMLPRALPLVIIPQRHVDVAVTPTRYA